VEKALEEAGLRDCGLDAIHSAPYASLAVIVRFSQEIAVHRLTAYLAELAMMVERELDKTGPSHSDRDAMHRAACASEAISEKLREEIAILVLAVRVTVVAIGDG
jgi:hypothetical protein